MDVYSGYNQILMYQADEQHTYFITDRGLYCYKVLSFGLKNVRATCQRFVNRMFADFMKGVFYRLIWIKNIDY